MQLTVDKIIANNCQDIAGTQLDIALPITQSVMQKIVLESVDSNAFNWIKSQVGPNNILLFKMNISTKIIFTTTFTLSLYIKLREKVAVSNAFHPIADIYGVENGLGFGKRKIMNKMRAAISQNLPNYLGFKEDCFYINWKNYFEAFEELPLSEHFFTEMQLSTEFEENTSEEAAAKAHKIWIKTKLAI